jgi:hypothetical protein
MDFNTFKNYNPEVRNMNRELQNLRYQHYEKLRTDTVKAVIDERNKIIENEKNNLNAYSNNESKINV